jgi:hypothetical protein
MSSAPCIYCKNLFDPTRGEGDHILPSALFGEFQYDIRFRGCCPECNNSFGIHEQILAQATPLGQFRAIVKPKQTRRNSSRRQRGAKGSKPPRTVVFASDHGELVEVGDDPRDVRPVDRLTIRDQDGSEHYVRLFKGMSAERLRSEIEKSGSKNFHVMFCSGDPDNVEFYKGLLIELYPSSRWEDRPDTEIGVRQVRGRTEFVFSVDAFRAIAKIAFHYYLVHNHRQYRGGEPEFNAIRDYIRNGNGNSEQFFDLVGPTFLMPFGETSSGRGTTPGNWCHVFATHEVAGNIVLDLRFFCGPGHEGEVHRVTLGRIQSQIVLPGAFWGHVYHYDMRPDDKYSGFVERARMQRLA